MPLYSTSSSVVMITGVADSVEEFPCRLLIGKERHKQGVFNLFGFNSSPLWGVKLRVRGICSPTYAKISRRNLQYPAALLRGFFIVSSSVGNFVSVLLFPLGERAGASALFHASPAGSTDTGIVGVSSWPAVPLIEPRISFSVTIGTSPIFII